MEPSPKYSAALAAQRHGREHERDRRRREQVRHRDVAADRDALRAVQGTMSCTAS
jgi:hypothetical protein